VTSHVLCGSSLSLRRAGAANVFASVTTLSGVVCYCVNVPTGPRPDPPNGTARVAIEGLYQGHLWVNVVWLLLTHAGDPDLGDFGEVVSHLGEGWGNGFGPNCTPDTHFAIADGTWYLGTGDLRAVTSIDLEGTGASETIDDAAACMCLNWVIGASYRGGHPRNYIPGPQSGQVTNGSDLSTLLQTDLADAATGILLDINGFTSGGISAVELGTVSFQTDNDWRDPPIFRPYIGAFAHNKLATQRRRIRN
jgi:hypothetical protein